MGKYFSINASLIYAEWGGEISLYNPYSGNTHLLNLFPFEIMQFLVLNSVSLSSICEHMAILCDEKNNDAWNNKVLSTLEQLEELELIELK